MSTKPSTASPASPSTPDKDNDMARKPSPAATPAVEAAARVGDGSAYDQWDNFPKPMYAGKIPAGSRTETLTPNLFPEWVLGVWFLELGDADGKAMKDIRDTLRDVKENKVAMPAPQVAHLRSVLDNMVSEIFSVTRGRHPDAALNQRFEAFFAAFKSSARGKKIDPKYNSSLAAKVESEWAKARGAGSPTGIVGGAFASRHLAGVSLPARAPVARGGIAGVRAKAEAAREAAAAAGGSEAEQLAAVLGALGNK